MITYSSDVLLESSAFNDPGGYYMVWDRCCRNGAITNIKSPGTAGSLFYLEFPPIIKNNITFKNSSPVFPAITGIMPASILLSFSILAEQMPMATAFGIPAHNASAGIFHKGPAECAGNWFIQLSDLNLD